MRASTSRGRPSALFFGLAAGTFVVDQLTKVVATGRLALGSPFPLLGKWVRLTLTHNTGSAFGLVSSGWVLIGIGSIVCVVILAYLAGGGLARVPKRAVPLGLILGGSLGNLVDRVRSGGVIDFIDLRVWPVFNFADVAITVGVGLLAVDVLRRR